MTESEMKDIQDKFYSCCKNGDLEQLKYLISIGADTSDDDNRPLFIAVAHNHMDIVKCLLEEDADITDEVFTCTSKHGNLEMVKYFVENGADVTARDNYAVRMASKNGHLEMVKYLVSEGACMDKLSPNHRNTSK